MKKINVLSLFDGIACGKVALDRAMIDSNYYASEIDADAIKIALNNYPNIIELGDVNNMEQWHLPKIDLLIGGSPCQNLSSANSIHKDGLQGEKSILFYQFVKALNLFKPSYFLFENVASMSKGDKSIITELLVVEPILINSAIVSAQNRRRLYWTNIPLTKALEEQNIKFKDILEEHNFTKFMPWCYKKTKWGLRMKMLNNINNDKSNPLTTKNSHPSMYLTNGLGISTLTANECEKLQTLPVDYTIGLSLTKRIHAIGNGWTVDVIKYFFDNLKQTMGGLNDEKIICIKMW